MDCYINKLKQYTKAPLSPFKQKLKPNSIILPSNTFNFSKIQLISYEQPNQTKVQQYFTKTKLLKSNTSIKDKMNDLFTNLNNQPNSKTYTYFSSMKKLSNTHNKFKSHLESKNNLTIEPNNFFPDNHNKKLETLLDGGKTDRNKHNNNNNNKNILHNDNNNNNNNYGFKEISTGFDSEDIITNNNNNNNNNQDMNESIISIEKDLEILNYNNNNNNNNSKQS